jgi:glycosyltransferase involved in cell wall biosynthesis
MSAGGPIASEVDRPLSVVVPCYNEEGSVGALLRRVLASDLVGQVIVVDDASTDGTPDVLRAFDDERIEIVSQPANRGKGAALRAGFGRARLPFVIVQDADLEYDPFDYPLVLGPLLAGDADVVFGSRFRGGREQRVLYFWHTVGNRFLTLASNVATNLNLTDMETCYKAFRTEIIQSIEIEQDRFGFEPEITAKVAALRCRVFEVGISYRGRTYDEGKKIGWRDGVHAMYCIVAYSPLGRRLGLRRLSRAVASFTGA